MLFASTMWTTYAYSADPPPVLKAITFGDSITAGLIGTIDDGASADCPSGVSLGVSFSGSGNMRCMGNGAEGVGGYQPELKASIEELGYDVSIYNYGYSGMDTSIMVGELAGDIAAQPSSNYVLLMGGANDVFDGLSSSTVKSNLQNMVNRICRAEMIPVLSTITRNLIGSYNSTVTSYNSEIDTITTNSSTDCLSRSIDLIRAEQYDALISADSFGSGVHLSPLGNSRMAAEWLSAMDIPEVNPASNFLPAVIMLVLDDT